MKTEIHWLRQCAVNALPIVPIVFLNFLQNVGKRVKSLRQAVKLILALEGRDSA